MLDASRDISSWHAVFFLAYGEDYGEELHQDTGTKIGHRAIM
jgi:hypothetical protein